jgi:signal transduction histidine kinase
MVFGGPGPPAWPTAVTREDDPDRPRGRWRAPAGGSTVTRMTSTGIRRFLGRYAVDLLVGAVLVIALLEPWLEDEVHGSPWALTLFALAWGLPLFTRRRFPVAAPAATVVLVAVQAAIWEHTVPYSLGAFLMVLIAVSQFGLLGPTTAGLAGAVLTAIAIVIVIVRDPNGSPGDLVFVSAIAAVAWLIGFAFHERNRRTVELTERAERAERARESEARAAAAEERARIAREMHDVVAHSLSVMVVQAEAAEAMLDSDPARARRPLAAVQETGRGALGELRRMLGVLREMAADGPALAPQPGLSGLDELVRQVREAGLPVSVRVEGKPRPLPPGIDLSAYRIVQEGLTNALKHAGPASAEVVVRYGPRDLELEVRDDGRGRGSGSNGGGHGLLGMRERVALYGGELAAGPRPGGGFALTARLPLEALGSP